VIFYALLVMNELKKQKKSSCRRRRSGELLLFWKMLDCEQGVEAAARNKIAMA